MKEIAYGLAGLMLLAVVYFGSYCLMVTPDAMVFDAAGFAKPEYRFGGEVVETLFSPVFALDRRFRPERWPPRPTPTIGYDVFFEPVK